jgi:hypothetical protein
MTNPSPNDSDHNHPDDAEPQLSSVLSIPLLKVQLHGVDSSNNQISIQLTPATPTSSEKSQTGPLLASPESMITNRSKARPTIESNDSDVSRSSDSMASPTSGKRMLAGPCNLERINIGDPDELTIQGYISSTSKKLLFYFGVICSFGLLLVYAEWQPELKVKLTHSHCPLDEAHVLILKVSVFVLSFFKNSVKTKLSRCKEQSR